MGEHGVLIEAGSDMNPKAEELESEPTGKNPAQSSSAPMWKA